MMEVQKLKTNKEYLISLYHLRMAAQEVLNHPDSAENKKKLCDCFGELVIGVDGKVISQAVLKTFNDVVATGKDVLKSRSQIDVLKSIELSSPIFSKEARNKFEKAKNALKKAQVILIKERAKIGNIGESEPQTVESIEDDIEVKALKEEVSRGVARATRISDEDKKSLLEALNTAETLKVKSPTDGKIEIQIGKHKFSFSVTFGSHKILDKQGKVVLTRVSGLEDILGDRARDFVAGIRQKKKTIIYKTALGKKNKAATLASRNEEQKLKNQRAKIKNLEKKIQDTETALIAEWQEILDKVDSQLVYKDLTSEKSFLRNTCGVSVGEIETAMAQSILRSGEIRKVQVQSEEGKKSDNKVEELWELFRAGDKDNNSFYDKLFEKVVDDECKREMETLIESSYHTSQQSPATAVKMLDIQSKKLMQQHDLPAEFGTRYMLEKVYQFGMGMYKSQFDEDKFEFMNECFKSYGMAIRLSKKVINKRCSPNIKLNDVIHEKDSKVKKYKKQMTALLYDMGQKLAVSDGNKLVYDLELKERYLNICREYSGDPLRDRGINESYWQDFVKNVDNQQKAKQTFDILNEEYGLEKAQQIVAVLREGNPLAGDSLHHVTYAYYAPLFGDNPELLQQRFNTRKNTVETLPTHPAFDDIHKDVEHKYNIGNGASVLVERNGRKRYVTVNTAQEGDILLIPVLNVLDENGKFVPLMQDDTLFITPSGKSVKEPEVSGCFARELSLLSDGFSGNGNDGRG